MNTGSGNQHRSRKALLMECLREARLLLSAGELVRARRYLAMFWRHYGVAPASSRRRWKCGH